MVFMYAELLKWGGCAMPADCICCYCPVCVEEYRSRMQEINQITWNLVDSKLLSVTSIALSLLENHVELVGDMQ